MTRQEISDDVWSVMEPLMPTVTGRSRPWTDHRLAVEGMAWKYRTGAPWRALPERFGPWQSVYDRHVRWSRDGTYDRLLAAAHTATDAAGELDWLVAADSSVMRVHQHGATARRTSGNAATVEVSVGLEGTGGSAAPITGGRSGILG